MTNPELRGESFLIIGYGREGKSTHSFLRRRFPQARIGIADRKAPYLHELQDEHTEIFTGDLYLEHAKNFDTAIRSPGISIRDILPLLNTNVLLTSATNIFFAECPGRIVGVTGTKGKSTTSSLTAAILQEGFSDVRLVGNIGHPMLDHIETATPETIFVVELSSYQLEDLRRSPHISILLNIVPEHLDYHGGFESYRTAKLKIASHQSERDILICNESFPSIADVIRPFAGTHLSFREYDDQAAIVRVCSEQIILRQDEADRPIASIKDLPVLGPGNLQNALASITCGVAFGLTIEQIRKGLLSFIPLEHRLEFVTEKSGIRFYNDSLSTIPEALTHALIALGDDVETIIAGGFDRGVEVTTVGAALAASKVKNLILFPTTGEKIWQAALAAAPLRSYTRINVENMVDAVQAAYNHTSAGKICVMSPAASSFSVFRDYRDRGDQFKAAVHRLTRFGD